MENYSIMAKCNNKLEIFRSTLDGLSINQGGLAKWMYMTVSKKTRDYISRKYCGSVEVISRDIVLIQLLQILEKDGYDLASVEFDDVGNIIQLKKS